MKKSKMVVMAMLAACVAVGGTACGGEKNILVVGRQSGSGTKSAFEEVVKKDGVKLQDATLTSDKEEYGDTGAVISKVETNRTAIGYVSLSEVSDTVKTIAIDGVAATVENVQNGSYAIKRPFLLLASTEYPLSAVAQDFFDFCMSEGQKASIVAEGCISAERGYATYSTATAALEGEIKVQGSTSMRELMTRMIGEYAKVQPDVKVSATYDGSSGGRSAVQNDVTGNTIGLASSSKESDKYEEHTLCLDAIAVIVNKENTLESISMEQLFDIYTGTIKKFGALSE